MSASKRDPGYESQKQIHQALGHSLRIELLFDLLENGPLSASRFAKKHDLGKEGLGRVAYHLKVLAKNDLVTLKERIPRRGSVENVYQLNGDSPALSMVIASPNGNSRLDPKVHADGLRMRISRVDHVLPGGLRGPIIISRDERDALYTCIVLRLNGIDAVRIAAEAEDWERAPALGQEFSDLLAFVCTDLGWGPGVGAEFRLRTPPEVLARVVQTVEREARVVDGAEMLLSTCRRIRTAALSQAG